MEGLKFGRLTVLKRDGSRRRNGGSALMWICQCECGNQVRAEGRNLRNKDTKSCGCLNREQRPALIASRVTHGDTRYYKVAPEYNSWAGMFKRCNNQHDCKYPIYGGRGISVCSRWRSYENFLADMGRKPSPKHSIDRINNDGNYEPDNCRWATIREQSLNKRKKKTERKT